MQMLVKDFISLSKEAISEKYDIKVGDTRTVEGAKADLQREEYEIVPILFRPFDVRYTALTNKSGSFLGRPRYSTMKHMVAGFENYALLVGRQNKSDEVDSFLGINIISEMKCAERTIQSCYLPLYFAEMNFVNNKVIPGVNFDAEIVKNFEKFLGRKFEWYVQESTYGITVIDTHYQ